METSTKLQSATEEKWGDTASQSTDISTSYIHSWESKMAEPQEQILGPAEDGAAGTLAPNAGTQLRTTQDEFTEH